MIYLPKNDIETFFIFCTYSSITQKRSLNILKRRSKVQKYPKDHDPFSDWRQHHESRHSFPRFLSKGKAFLMPFG